MMIKVIPPGSYNFGERAAGLIKMASSGLRGNDLAMLIKRAGHEFADKVKDMPRDPGEELVHLIALGSTESVGPNRNGDGFKNASCRKYHTTFVKHARFYRNHKNKDPKISYGIVKMSMFHEPMKRVELLVALNGTKQAADKNNGLIAEEELNKLEKGDEIGVSMACKVAYDVCSGCGNKAKNKDEYCLGEDEGGTCKYGGLKNNIGIVHEDGHHLHADNPHPLFFDISRVFRPADRTAYIMGKVANTGVVSGVELAESLGVTAPFDLLDETDYTNDVLGQIKIARELASRETAYIPNELDRAFIRDSNSGVDGIEEFSHYQRAGVLRALTQEKIALSVIDWLKLTTGASGEKCAEAAAEIEPHLPTVFNELIEDPSLTELLRNSLYKSAEVAPKAAKVLAIKQAADYSLERNRVQRRIWQSTLRQNERPRIRTKSAVASSVAAQQLAKQYGIYQIGFLHDLKDLPDLGFLQDMVIRGNRIG